jgi:hypothetical protein
MEHYNQTTKKGIDLSTLVYVIVMAMAFVVGLRDIMVITVYYVICEELALFSIGLCRDTIHHPTHLLDH